MTTLLVFLIHLYHKSAAIAGLSNLHKFKNLHNVFEMLISRKVHNLHKNRCLGCHLQIFHPVTGQVL